MTTDKQTPQAHILASRIRQVIGDYVDLTDGRYAQMMRIVERELSSPQNRVAALPQDVINLVIAAREFWDGNNDLSEESRSLDKALEAFASRVPYENEPAATEGTK